MQSLSLLETGKMDTKWNVIIQLNTSVKTALMLEKGQPIEKISSLIEKRTQKNLEVLEKIEKII